MLNIHPALLPSFRGLHGQKQALDYGVRYSGCTVHFVDAGVDTGPIIVQRVVPVLQDDDEERLSARILREEHVAYPEAVRLFAEGKLRIEGRSVYILNDS
jgi:phosphoribosylglycinamide formyltransferase-1